METRTILVAEDDENDFFLMRRAFVQAQSQSALRFVADGAEALAYLRAEPPYGDRSHNPFPGLLLLDLKMPQKNGLEVLQSIRADPELKRLTVVIFTSSNQERDIDLALGLGANSYLVKPSEPAALASLLHRVEDYWLTLHQGSTSYQREAQPQV